MSSRDDTPPNQTAATAENAEEKTDNGEHGCPGNSVQNPQLPAQSQVSFKSQSLTQLLDAMRDDDTFYSPSSSPVNGSNVTDDPPAILIGGVSENEPVPKVPQPTRDPSSQSAKKRKKDGLSPTVSDDNFESDLSNITKMLERSPLLSDKILNLLKSKDSNVNISRDIEPTENDKQTPDADPTSAQPAKSFHPSNIKVRIDANKPKTVSFSSQPLTTQPPKRLNMSEDAERIWRLARNSEVSAG